MTKIMKSAFATAAALMFTFVVLTAGVTFTTGPAQAMSFKDAAKSGAIIKIDQLDPMKGFLAKAASKAISKLPLTNVKADGGGLTGEVSMRGLQWTVIVNAGDDASTSFIAFAPKTKFKFSHLIGNNPAAKMFDLMTFDRQMLLIAAADVELDSGDMPDNVKAALAPLYDDASDFTLSLDEGFSLLSSLNIGKSKVIKASLDFLGAKSSVLQMKGVLSVTILDSMVEALSAPKTPTLKLVAVVPEFRPKLGGLVELPADIQFNYVAELEKGGKPVLGMEGETKFSIGSQDMNIVLSNSINLGKGAPDFVVSATLFDGLPYEKAFGISWLTIANYKMVFKLNASGTLVVQFEGDTSIGEKAVTLGGGLSIGTKTAGLPIPTKLLISIDDGPDKVGSLGLKDILGIYNAMAKATGNPATVPLDQVPDISIAGTGKGKENGPKIELLMEGGGDDGFDIRGKLRIFGADVAVIDKAYVNAGEGIDIRARVNKFKAGPITLPHGDAEIVIKLEQITNTESQPHVLIRAKGLSLFGSKQEMELSLYLAKSHFIAKQHLGHLFKFDFAAHAVAPDFSSFAGLGSTQFRVDAKLSSDPGLWIRTAGKKEAKQYLEKLDIGADVALKALDAAKKEVARLDRLIVDARAKVKREREPAINTLKRAEAEVKRLQGQIDKFERRRVEFRRQIKSCNQTRRICVRIGLRRTGCYKSVAGHCVIPSYYGYCAAHANIPNYPARGVCEAKNTKPRTEMAWADTKKHGLKVAKAAAVETVAGIRKSINKLPVELDPRVAALIAAKESANIWFIAAKESVKGVLQFGEILNKGIQALDAPDIFALEKSGIEGDLFQAISGEPVIIDMNFRVKGKPFRSRFSFSMDLASQKDNVRRFGILALGIAVKEVIKIGKKMKVIPHDALDRVEAFYLDKLGDLDEELKKVTQANETGNIKLAETVDAKRPTMAQTIIADQTVRRKDAAIEQARLIKLQKNAVEKLSKARLAQLNSLLRGNKWKKMPGQAKDITAGANGSVWAIGQDTTLWSWNGSNWKKMPGNGLRIDVGPDGRAWYIGTDNTVYRGDGKTITNMRAQAVDIGVGADGSVWIIRAKGGKSAGISRWNGSKWTNIKGGITTPSWPKSPDGRMFKRLAHTHAWKSGIKRIDVDDKGRAWIVFGNNYMARWNPKTNKWNGIAGHALDIGVGADGTPVSTRFDEKVPGQDYAPFVWGGKKWSRLSGGMSQITVDKNGDPWGIDAAGNVWAWDAAAKAKAAHITKAPTPPKPQTGGGSPVPGSFGKLPVNKVMAFQVKHAGKCIDTTKNGAQGLQTQIWDCVNNLNQQFNVVYKSGEWFNLVNKRTKRCLDVAVASKNNGGIVHQWSCHGGTNQQWRKVDQGGGWFLLQARHSNKCLDVASALKPNGSKLHQWDCHKGPNQQFRMK